MPLSLSRLGQVTLAVGDLDVADTFYGEVLGLRRLQRYDGLCFFDLGGVRLMIERAEDPAEIARASPLYFVCADLALTMQALTAQGVSFAGPAHLVARMDDHDLWMAFFMDPDGHVLALMQEAPKDYSPVG